MPLYTKQFLYISLLSLVAGEVCTHPDATCSIYHPWCGPIQNYDGSPFFISCIGGNNECDCQPEGFPVSDPSSCILIPNKLECVECLGGTIENSCNGGLGMCFQKENAMYRCVKKISENGQQLCAFEKDNTNCFCQPDSPPSSPGDPERCNLDLNKCSPDGEEFCLAPGGQCNSIFDPILCSCGTQGFCQDTPDQMCGGDLHTCFMDSSGHNCLPPSTYWCGKSPDGKCTIERNPEKCNSCEDFCIPQSSFDTSCGGDAGKCSDSNCYCSISENNKCNPRFDPSKCGGRSEFCTGTPSTNCDGHLGKCLDFDHMCEVLDVGANRRVCSIIKSPNICPAVNCNIDTCNSSNDICKCENGKCSFLTSDECEKCLGGITDDQCNGGLGKCINGKECYVEQSISGGILIESCGLKESEKCFCPSGSEDSDCFHNIDKCTNDGKRCVIDPITKMCDLQRGHDSFCCLEGTFENKCNSLEEACIHTGRCVVQHPVLEKCVIINDARCYASNFCEGDISTGCNGDINKCSSNGHFERCSSDWTGKCIIVQDDGCCTDGGIPNETNRCNNNQDNCIGSKKCFADASGFCTLDISKDSCFCSGTPDDNCAGQLGTSFDGETVCKIIGNKCVQTIDLGDNSFCESSGENCNGNLGYCHVNGKKCVKNSQNKCVLEDDISCCEMGTPGGTNKCNSHEDSCDGDWKCKASSDESSLCVLEKSSECICRNVGQDCNGNINKCISTGGKCKKDETGSCVIEKDMMCCQGGTMQDNCFGNSFTCYEGTNFCVPISSTGYCDIVQLQDCFCKGDADNRCDNDLNKCFDGLLCELIISGGNKICQASLSDTCNGEPLPIPISPSVKPTTNPTTTPNPVNRRSPLLSKPALISVVISSSVVAVVGGSILIRRWYLRRNQMNDADDSFM